MNGYKNQQKYSYVDQIHISSHLIYFYVKKWNSECEIFHVMITVRFWFSQTFIRCLELNSCKEFGCLLSWNRAGKFEYDFFCHDKCLSLNSEALL